MKKAIFALAALLVSVASYGQGQVLFKTHIGSDTPPIDFKILNADLTPAANAFAEIGISGPGGSFTALTLNTPGPAVVNGSGYVNAGGAAAPAGNPNGTVVNLIIRAWVGGAGSTYDTASVRGIMDHTFSATLAEAPNTPPDLLSLGTGQLVLTPEPTTLALGAVGLGALALYRRKSK